MRILFSGGGTGGHFFPVLAIVKELKRLAASERFTSFEIFYMSPDDFGYDLLSEEGVIPVKISTGKWRNYFSFKNYFDIFRTAFGIWEALWNFFLIIPDVVFIKGGYGSLPAVVAAVLFRIPIVVHESDAVPGKVNRLASKFARRVAISFEGAASFFPAAKTAFTGIPVRKAILGGRREDARADLNIYSDAPVVSFLGGSQGAEKINSVVAGSLKELILTYEVLHQTGEKQFDSIKKEAAIILGGVSDRYHAFGFLDGVHMRAMYAASDVLIARAGGTTIYEIATWGRPAILIPLRSAAQDHQKKNAYEYAARGAAFVMEEENLTPHLLLAGIEKIFNDPDIAKKMSAEAQRFSKIDAAEVLARELLKLGVH